MMAAGRWADDWSKLQIDMNRMLDCLPIGDVGRLLLHAKRESDLDRWGKLAFDKALDSVGNPPFARAFWGTAVYTVDSTGQILGSTCDGEESDPTNAQEVLRPSEQDPFEALRNQLSTEQQWESRANEGVRIWREDEEGLKQADGGLLNRFGATQALRLWRDRHPDIFRSNASELLARSARDPGKAFHIGAFVLSVLDALVPLDPELAVKGYDALCESALRVKLINEYGVPTFLAALWHAAGEGNGHCIEICARQVEHSSSDRELMIQAMTAQAEGATEVLLSFSRSLLKAPLAMDRCLAISLLAWVPDSAQIVRLEELLASEPSGWVRKHAEWAIEVAKHEASLRRHYERTLKETDRNTVLSRLQALDPALTPTAAWWHRDFEARDTAFLAAPSATRAAVPLFWYDRRNESKKAPELFGRKLNDYLRGECIRDLHSPKPRLIASGNRGHLEPEFQIVHC
jgi:hypothetical protein